MRRQRLKFFVVLGLGAISACGRAQVGPAQYSDAQCRRVALVDAVTGARLIGAEDFATERTTGRLFISVYNRRSVERAARKREHKIPEGGVYEVSLPEIFAGKATSITAKPLIASGEIAGGLRPHGISYDSANGELVFINRAYHRSGRGWKMEPHLQRIGADGALVVAEKDSVPCNANDVLATTRETYTSFDHSACNWMAGVEDIFRLKRSGVIDGSGARLYERAAFANGLAETLGGDVVVAATRENALIFLTEQSGALDEKTRIKTPGGPDNLTLADDGGVVAAVHPSMLRLALNRKLSLGKAPSRIVKADPKTGALQILFDDPSGKLFSAATVAVQAPDGLIAGSVTDMGLLVCRASA
jgi:hypothetical protein